MNTRGIGSGKEDVAADYIRSNGGRITDRNFRSRMGEIDIVARDEDTVCFVGEIQKKQCQRASG